MEQIKSLAKELWKESWFRWGMAGVLLSFFILALRTTDKSTGTASPVVNEQDQSVDTFIPAGFVLVPIQIQNLEALQAMIGGFARVDLYPNGKSHPLVRGVRLIRSPREPSQMAVLVNEDLSPMIVQASQVPLWVVVQNREVADTVPTDTKSNYKSRIQWGDAL